MGRGFTATEISDVRKVAVVHPARRNFNVIFAAGAVGAYIGGTFGVWEIVYPILAIPVVVVASVHTPDRCCVADACCQGPAPSSRWTSHLALYADFFVRMHGLRLGDRCVVSRWPLGAWQPRDTGGTPRYDRRILTLLKHPLDNLILAREPHAIVIFGIGEKSIEHPDPVCMPVDAIVEANEHQAAPSRTFFVELIKLVSESLLISHRIVAFEGERRDVIHMECVRNSDEILPIYWNDEGLVVAGFIDVINETELLKCFQYVDRISKPVRIPSDRALSGDFVNRLHAICNESLLLVPRKEI